MKKEVITSVDPKSPVSEVFRTLRTNLQYLNKKNGAQTILLTSTLQGEGKSFVATNLAVTFAQTGKNVIIVDTDMRRPRQHKILNIDMYPGLSNYLSGVNINRGSHKINLKECVYQSKIDNLFVLPAGNIPPNPSELLQSEKLGEMIDELKENFDVVIFDGAPTLLVTDATLVSRLVDATVLVVSQGKTKVDDLKEVKNRIKRVGGNVVGVVLNRVKISSKKYGEKYYYSSNRLQDRTRRRREAEDDSYDTYDFGTKKMNSMERESKVEDDFNMIPTSSYKKDTLISKDEEQTREGDRKKTSTTSRTNIAKKNSKAEESGSRAKRVEVNLNDNSTGSEKIQQILAEINKLKEDK